MFLQLALGVPHVLDSPNASIFKTWPSLTNAGSFNQLNPSQEGQCRNAS